MLKINEKGMVNAKDIYHFVEVKTKFWDWLRRCIDYADLKEGIDFNSFLSESSGGRRPIDYYFTINAAKEMCIVSATKKAKELRRWLISLSEQKENLDLLTHDQVIMLSVLKTFFRYIDNQKDISKKHLDTYVENNSNLKNPYAEFHIWRNRILNIEKETLDKKIKEYCIENMRRLPKLITSHDKIRFLNEYDSLRNAVWDFLNIKGEINSMKLANLVKKMAEAENLVIFQHNENNLFQSKENIDLKQLK